MSYQWWISTLVELDANGVSVHVAPRTGFHMVCNEQNSAGREHDVVAGKKRVGPVGRDKITVLEPHHHHTRIFQ